MSVPARENPFAVHRLERLAYRFDSGAGWEELLRRLKTLRLRAAIVGPQGSGKTTLLKELLHRLEDEGLRSACLTLRSDDARPASAVWRFLRARSRAEILAIDGAERLSAPAWRLLRGVSHLFRGLIATTHAPGRLPSLHECRTRPALLQELVAELSPAADMTPQIAAALFADHRGNIRDALLACYLQIARAPAGGGAPAALPPLRT